MSNVYIRNEPAVLIIYYISSLGLRPIAALVPTGYTSPFYLHIKRQHGCFLKYDSHRVDPFRRRRHPFIHPAFQ